MEPEVLGGGKLKDRIVSILSLHHPLTAKLLFNRLKNDFQISITYQGVHKALTEMVREGILLKDARTYEISTDWLNRLSDFRDKVVENYNKDMDNFSKIKVISFDMDGCLSDNSFDELVWRTEIPTIYAKEKTIPFTQAFEEVTKEYKRLWGKVDGWRDPEFWFKHFGFKTSWSSMVEHLKPKITQYGDVLPILKELKKRYRLIIISHADRKFLDLKLESNHLGDYFDRTYSTPNDFHEYKKNKEIFLKVCKDLSIDPKEMIHIGDSPEYDFKVPTSAGIKSFVIDRIGTEKKDNVVRDMYEFRDKILR